MFPGTGQIVFRFAFLPSSYFWTLARSRMLQSCWWKPSIHRLGLGTIKGMRRVCSYINAKVVKV